MNWRRVWGALVGFALLGACGVDGPPVPPEPRKAGGIVISGQAEVGVVVRN